MERRQFVSTAIFVVSSGCLGRGTGGPAKHLGEFVLRNDDDTAHEILLAVRRNGTEVLETRRTLQAGTSTRVANPIERQGTYRVTATLEDGTEERVRWRIDSCHSVAYRQIYVDEHGRIEIREMRQTVVPTPECSGTLFGYRDRSRVAGN